VAEEKPATEEVKSNPVEVLAGGATQNIFDTPSGLLNAVESPIVRKARVSTHNFDGFGAIRGMMNSFFSEDLLTGLGSLNGIVLRMETNQKEGGVASFFLDLLGLAEKPLVRAKVRIPEIHKMLPVPAGMGDPGYPASKNENDQIIDMYPTFDAESTDQAFDTIKVGDIINVAYTNKNNWSTTARPLITSVVKVPPPPAGSAAGMAGCTDTNTYNSEPPKGDAIGGANGKTSHTGEQSPSKRTRDKRTTCQIFMDSNTYGLPGGYTFSKELVTLFKSRGYSVLGTEKAVTGITAHNDDSPIIPSDNEATIEGLIQAVRSGVIQKGVSTVVIQFNKFFISPEPTVNTAKQDVVRALTQEIDAAAGDTPKIIFIGPWYDSKTPTENQHHRVTWTEVFNTPPLESTAEGKNRIFAHSPTIFWSDIVSAGKSDPDAKGPGHDKDMTAVKALIINQMNEDIAIKQSDPVPGDTSAPPPKSRPAKESKSPYGYWVIRCLLNFLLRKSFKRKKKLKYSWLISLIS